MKPSVSSVIAQAAREYYLEVHVDSLHGIQGIELRKRIESSDMLACIGYYLRSPEEVEIYRMTLSKRDEFYRNRLWFFWIWLIKPRQHDNRHKILKVLPSSEFTEELFIEIVKQELKPKPIADDKGIKTSCLDN